MEVEAPGGRWIVMEAIRKLEQAGYRFELHGEKIKYKFTGPGEPDYNLHVYFEEIKKDKPEALKYLRQQKYMALFKQALAEINAIYEEGMLHSINEKYPEASKEMDYLEKQLESLLNRAVVGEQVEEEFKSILEKWKRTLIRLIEEETEQRR